MKIILHADDFGFDEDTTRATIELLDRGVLTSATIMPKMPYTEIACNYAAHHPELSFGLHLTYVDGLEPCADKVPSLTGPDGRFLISDVVRKKALLFKLNRNDILRESLAQIKVLRDAGVKVSHLDSHGHLHKFPSFLLALNDITKTSGINKVRRVQNVFINPHKTGVTSILNSIFAHYISRRFKSTDYFYMSANSLDKKWSDALLKELDLLPPNSIIEVGVHPGTSLTGEEAWRVDEYKDVIEFSEKIRKGGKYQLINWNEV